MFRPRRITWAKLFLTVSFMLKTISSQYYTLGLMFFISENTVFNFSAAKLTVESIVLTSDTNIKTKDAIIRTKDTTVKTMDAFIKTMDAIIKTKDAVVKTMDTTVKTMDAIIKSFVTTVNFNHLHIQQFCMFTKIGVKTAKKWEFLG